MHVEDNLKSTFRQYKILTNSGHFVNNPRDLSNYYKAYQSSSFWLSPKTLHGKQLRGAGYPIRDRCFLGAELLLDFDVKGSWEAMQQDIIKALDFFKGKPYKLQRIQFSGSHGFHVIYDDKTPYKAKMSQQRLEEFKKRRIRLKAKLEKLQLQTLDIKLITDPYRIYKVPDSHDYSTGYKVQEIKEEDMRLKPIQTILGSLEKAMTGKRPFRDIGRGRPSRIRLPSQTFITNQVYGVKDGYIPSIIVSKLRLHLIRKLQKSYSLGTLHFFIRNDIFVIMGVKVVCFKRLLKIYHAFNAMNLSTLMNLGHSKVYLDAKYIGDMPVVTSGWYSRPHSYFLQKIGADVFTENLIGIEKFKYAIQAVEG